MYDIMILYDGLRVYDIIKYRMDYVCMIPLYIGRITSV